MVGAAKCNVRVGTVKEYMKYAWRRGKRQSRDNKQNGRDMKRWQTLMKTGSIGVKGWEEGMERQTVIFHLRIREAQYKQRGRMQFKNSSHFMAFAPSITEDGQDDRHIKRKFIFSSL